ncbi:hypothetical protein Clacol_007842 [Clathrus columnatus]|uniref:Uncharacterized protein n=1 Tax=Clathrus columnatus TaxID=1419009 RepID=A0AAV5AKW7_9AGAM|nr:hypothetical protein Clacol_007842 [Clathrus columnatus]
MACTVLRTHSSVPCHDLSQSQYLPPPPFLDIDSILSEMLEMSTDRYARAVYKSRLREEFDTSQAFRLQVLTFLDYFASLKRNCMEEDDGIHQLPFSCVDSTESLVASEKEGTNSIASHSRSCSRSVSSSRKSFTQIPNPVPGRRTMLLPPRPRLSSPLTPHPHVPQDGPNPRRPIPKKRRQAEKPLLRQALFNCSNVEKKLSSRFNSDPDTHDRRTFTQLQDDFDLESCSSWTYIPLPLDDWELIRRDELY